MRIVLINPIEKSIFETSFPDGAGQLREYLGVRPTCVGRLPNGDRLLVARHRRGRHLFSLGRLPSGPGPGVIVGPRREGNYLDAVSDADDIRRLVRFDEVADYEFETTPAALGGDLDRLVALLGSSPPIYVDVVPLAGCEHGWCWQNVAKIVESEGGRVVFGWTIWERARLFLTGEFHAIWQTPHGHLIDVTPKPDGEDVIAFSPEPRCPIGFDFMSRPNNKRLRTYHARKIDVASIMDGLGGAGRALARRRADKRGLTVEEFIKEKNADPLAAEIDAMFETCRQIEGITQVYPDGLFCKYPERLAALELQKLRQHNRMMEFARKRFAETPNSDSASSATDDACGKPQP
jgi:hypothetical protein